MKQELKIYCENVIQSIFKKNLSIHIQKYEYFEIEETAHGIKISAFDDDLVEISGLSVASVFSEDYDITLRLSVGGKLAQCFDNHNIKIYAVFYHYQKNNFYYQVKDLEYFEKLQIIGLPDDLEELSKIYRELEEFETFLLMALA